MNPTLRAALWMVGAIISFSLMAIAGRAVSEELDTFEIMTYRSLVGLVIVVVGITMLDKWHEISCHRLGTHIIRNVFHFSGQNLWFYALTLIPLAQVFALEFTSPLWVLILSPFFLGERLTKIRCVAAVLGFVGILLVTRPSPETLNIGTLAAAAAAIGFAGTLIFTKKLTATATLSCILFFMTLTQSVLGLTAAGFDGDIALPTYTAGLWVGLIGLCGLGAHFCLTSALSIAPAIIVVPFDFTRLPLIALIGYLLYGEPLDSFILFGACVIFGANYLNIWSETRKTRRFP